MKSQSSSKSGRRFEGEVVVPIQLQMWQLSKLKQPDYRPLNLAIPTTWFPDNGRSRLVIPAQTTQLLKALLVLQGVVGLILVFETSALTLFKLMRQLIQVTLADLLNAQGEVIGVNTAIIGERKGWALQFRLKLHSGLPIS